MGVPIYTRRRSRAHHARRVFEELVVAVLAQRRDNISSPAACPRRTRRTLLQKKYLDMHRVPSLKIFCPNHHRSYVNSTRMGKQSGVTICSCARESETKVNPEVNPGKTKGKTQYWVYLATRLKAIQKYDTARVKVGSGDTEKCTGKHTKPLKGKE